MKGLRSIRARLVGVTAILTGLLLAAALYTQSLVGQAGRYQQESIREQQAVTRALDGLKSTLYSMESGLYRYAIMLDSAQRQAVRDQMAQAQRQVGNLRRQANDIVSSGVNERVDRLAEELKELRRESEHLLAVIADVDRRFPASPIFTEHTYPANVRFLTAVDSAIAEGEQSGAATANGEVVELFKELRYQWAQQISLVRMFIANRSGVFGMPEAGMRQHLRNRQNYLSVVQDLLQRLTRMDERGQLGFVQSAALTTMKRELSEFQRHFQRAVAIYRSGNWRSDISLMRERVQPAFASVWDLASGLDRQLVELNSRNAMRAMETAGTVSRFLWIITGVVVLVLAMGIVVYEYVLRRPMYQVAQALEAFGQGGSYSPLLTTGVTETDRLLSSFRAMQQQVYTREMRLSAVLDNASEGIITINDQGVVENFNSAAETLFGYRADEIIGRNVSLLMPHPTRDEHDDYIRRYLETREPRIIGNEINVSAQRKDGSVFPMSIKLSEMILEGRHYFTAIVADISEHKAMLDRLRQLAEHDSLTGLYNRQYFTEELERVVARSRRQQGLDCALLYIDLDNFKYVNDTLGHLAGDQVLVEIGNILRKRTRESDLIARLGGDEFAVLLYDVDHGEAVATAEHYRQRIADYEFRYEGRVIDIGCSIGVAMFETDVNDREDLMARADVSCHMAKRAGRNSIHVYQAEDQVRMDTMFADMGWARTIKEAIEGDRFFFAMQPIVDIHSQQPVSHEVLLRMRDDEGGTIMPAGFMPSAERFGLVLEIDRWVVRHAIEWLAPRLGAGGGHLSINLSAMSIGDEELLRLVTETLEATATPASRICFEITETVAIADLAAAARFLERLRALGCKTALDDFGVGYCSFAYLKDLPVDYVKIDGSFVRDIGKDALQLAMVKSMNEIAHAMGKRTVAEFVESERVLDMLRAIGVDYVQGYLTGRPEVVPVDGDRQAAGSEAVTPV